MIYLIVFVAALNADVAAFRPVVAAGPFPSLEVCAAMGALSVSRLNEVNPTKDFKVECAPDQQLRRHPAVPLYDLRDLVAIADKSI